MKQSEKFGTCEICGRETNLTFHHLIPRTCHTNKWFKKHFSKEDMKKRGAEICADCHRFIHHTYGEKELGRNFNTIEKLMADQKFQKFIRWIKKQK